MSCSADELSERPAVAPDEPPLIRVEDLVLVRGSQRVLDGVSFTVERGEVLVVMGMSGTGKSTLLKCLGGLLRPSGGRVEVVGQDVGALRETKLNELRREIGMVFQYAALFDSLTVFENVAFGLLHPRPGQKRTAAGDVQRTVAEALTLVGLGDRAVQGKLPSELSGGMRKRVGIARALALRPRILLYDEPTSGLDPIMTAVISDLITGLRDRLGVTSVVVSHDLEASFRVADRVGLLHDGRFLALGAPEAIRRSDQPVVRQFVEGRADGPVEVA